MQSIQKAGSRKSQKETMASIEEEAAMGSNYKEQHICPVWLEKEKTNMFATAIVGFLLQTEYLKHLFLILVLILSRLVKRLVISCSSTWHVWNYPSILYPMIVKFRKKILNLGKSHFGEEIFLASAFCIGNEFSCSLSKDHANKKQLMDSWVSQWYTDVNIKLNTERGKTGAPEQEGLR